MSCGCTDTNPCETIDCGCKFEVDAGCVRYTGENLGAIGAVKGETLHTILETLNTKFEEYGPGDYIELEDEYPGTNCTYGGIKIILRDGDDHSIKSTKYVCGVDATSTLDGSGTFNTIAMWTPDGNSLGDSIITQSGTVATVGGTIKITGGSPGLGKFLKSDADGDGSWSTITESDITGFGAYVKTDGTTPLTANWNAGSFTITSNKIVSTIDATVNGLTVGKGTGSISSNTAIGVNALLTNASGVNSVAVGFHSLYYNTTGSTNTAIGVSTLGANTTGSSNTAVGTSSAYSNSIGTSNTSVGAYSMFNNTIGSGITAIGTRSLENNLTGNYNSGFGFSSLYTNETGAYNTALGYGTLYYNLSGGYNTAAGHQALQNNTTSTGNVGFGYRALGDNQTSAKHAAFGYNALSSHTTGDDNTSIGYNAGNVLLDGTTPNTGNTNNIFIGAQTKSAALTTSNEIVIGAYAIGNGNNTTTIGNSSVVNTYISGGIISPKDALINNVTLGRGAGDITSNTALGKSALALNTTGYFNTAVGYSALSSNLIGNENTAVGRNALVVNTSDANTAVGSSSLGANTSGSANTALGYRTLIVNQNGDQNTAVGATSLAGNLSGNYNVGVGSSSLSAITTGNYNVAIGTGAGSITNTGASVTSLTGNTIIGHLASTLNSGDVNQIIIGYGAKGNGSGTTTIGNVNTTEFFLHGDMRLENTAGVGTASLTQTKYLNIKINGAIYKMLLAE